MCSGIAGVVRGVRVRARSLQGVSLLFINKNTDQHLFQTSRNETYLETLLFHCNAGVQNFICLGFGSTVRLRV